jgi:hypothetical protein
MRKIVILLSFIFATTSCSNNIVEKPDNLIEDDVMVDIFYDLSIIEASKNMGYSNGVPPMESNNYILKKYKIDSLQFAKSNKYYAADIKKYKRMFNAVNIRLTEKDAELTKTLLQKTGKQLAPAAVSIENQ